MEMDIKPPSSKMSELSPNIMFCIADHVQMSSFPTGAGRLALLNRHWARYMRKHPLFCSAFFDMRGSLDVRPSSHNKLATTNDIKAWKSHPHRKKQPISGLLIRFNNDAKYRTLCQLLEKEYTKVNIDHFAIDAFLDVDVTGLALEKVHLPMSLRARHVQITCDQLNATFAWNSLNPYLLDNLVSLKLDLCYFNRIPATLQFQSLRELSSFIATTEILGDVQGFLMRHSGITSLSFKADKDSDFLPLSIDWLDALECLDISNVPVMLNTGKVQPIKRLSYNCMRLPILRWTSIKDTLTYLSVTNACNDLAEVFGAYQDMTSFDTLHKLRNVQHFTFANCKSPDFDSIFSCDEFDFAMPHLQTLDMDAYNIPKYRIDSFIDEHEYLNNVHIRGKDFTYRYKIINGRKRRHPEDTCTNVLSIVAGAWEAISDTITQGFEQALELYREEEESEGESQIDTKPDKREAKQKPNANGQRRPLPAPQAKTQDQSSNSRSAKFSTLRSILRRLRCKSVD